MIGFRKTLYYIKVLQFSVAVVFFVDSAVFAIEVSQKTHLRVPMLKKDRMKKAIFVHLGNVGRETEEEEIDFKTSKLARAYPNVEFIGIDSKTFLDKPLLSNWQQWEADFIDGLDGFADNSVKNISSDHALGAYPDPKNPDKNPATFMKRVTEYTTHVIQQAFRKLEEDGKLMISIHEMRLDVLKDALSESQFDPDEIKIRELRKVEYGRTYWNREYGKGRQKLFQIIARKTSCGI